MNELAMNPRRTKKIKTEDRFFDDLSKIDSNVFSIKGPNDRGWYAIHHSDYPTGKKSKVWSTIDIVNNDPEYCVIDVHKRDRRHDAIHTETGRTKLKNAIRRIVPNAEFKVADRKLHPTFYFKVAYYKEVVEAMFNYLY